MGDIELHPRPFGGRAPRRLVAGILAGALLLAGCGGAAAPSPDRRTAPKQIQHAYGVLFDFADKSVAAKVSVVEDGSKIRAALVEGLSSTLSAQATGAKVTRTVLLSASRCADAAVAFPCAKVTYDILGAHGAPLIAGSIGYAVFVEGRWLVAKSTACGLLVTMFSTLGKTGTPPGC